MPTAHLEIPLSWDAENDDRKYLVRHVTFISQATTIIDLNRGGLVLRPIGARSNNSQSESAKDIPLLFFCFFKLYVVFIS